LQIGDSEVIEITLENLILCLPAVGRDGSNHFSYKKKIENMSAIAIRESIDNSRVKW